MVLKDFFTKPKKKKYATIPTESGKNGVPEGLMSKCPECRKILYTKELQKNLNVCLHCGYHLKMTARERIESLVDEGTFVALDENLASVNPLQFPGYLEKIQSDQEKTNLKDAVVCGTGLVNGNKIVLSVMDSSFRMGSMGSVVGEKITRAIEEADKLGVPFIIFTASGGARMQEGVLSLMQMAKTSAALNTFGENGNLFISVMTHPTTGGVSASFASLGDFNFAEPGALIGFAGRRIIEQTIREELPEDFQTAEFLLEHGQLDAVIHRHDIKDQLGKIVSMHQQVGECTW